MRERERERNRKSGRENDRERSRGRKRQRDEMNKQMEGERQRHRQAKRWREAAMERERELVKELQKLRLSKQESSPGIELNTIGPPGLPRPSGLASTDQNATDSPTRPSVASAPSGPKLMPIFFYGYASDHVSTTEL